MTLAVYPKDQISHNNVIKHMRKVHGMNEKYNSTIIIFTLIGVNFSLLIGVVLKEKNF